MNVETKICQNCKQNFVIDADDFTFYEKIQVPPPTWCPECRLKRRMIWRNYRFLFRHKDAISGKELFSSFPAAVPAKVYELDYWNSDAWDPMTYGREYDFSKNFFEQFKALLYDVPWPSRAAIRLVNSDYCNQAGGFKNCYLCFNGDDFENAGYCTTGVLATDSFDLHEVRHTELSYDGYMIDESFRVFYSVNVEESTDIWFSRNIFGCTNCFGCINLRKKSYHIFNEPYSREAYMEFMAKFKSGSHAAVEEMKQKARAHWKKFPMKYGLLINVTNATGEHIERSKNIKQGYGIHEGENIAYSQDLSPPVADCYDYTSWGHGASRIYESIVTGEECDLIRFSWDCWPSSRGIEYSVSCRSSSDLFGCVGLKKKKYCIFNTQYSKEDFFALREKIIAQMNAMPYVSRVTSDMGQGTRELVYRYGEFFPTEFSPFAYNETLTQDLFPLTKEQAEAQGYLWREPETRTYSITLAAKDLPDNIADIADTITKEVIGCIACGKPYRIIPMEFDFFRRMVLPIPRKCPECRFQERFQFVNPPKLWPGGCMCHGAQGANSKEQIAYPNSVQHFHGDAHCPNEFQTSYAPGRTEIVYCEACYQNETA